MNECETEEVLKNREILTVAPVWKKKTDDQGSKDINSQFGQTA